MYKSFLFKVHLILGLSAGIILLIIGLTGAMLSFEKDILQFINKDSYHVKVSEHRLSTSEILNNFKEKFPDSKINAITFSKDESSSVVINVQGEGRSARRGINYFINPYNAELLSDIKGFATFKFIENIHRKLAAGEVGKQITAASTLMLFVLMITGIYLYWKRIKKAFFKSFTFSFKDKKRTFLSNMHSAIGMWVIPFYLLLSITGLSMSYDWWNTGLYKIAGVEKPVRHKRMQNNKAPRDTNKKEISNEEIEKAIVLFNKNVKDYKNANLRFDIKKGVLNISYYDVNTKNNRARNQIALNIKSEKVIKHEKFDDKPLNERLMKSIVPLHTGEYFGLIGQTILGLASLMMVLFTVTGFMMYFKRKKKKSAKKI